MEQGTDIEIGQSVTYTIAGRQVVLKPLSLGRMKKASLVFTEKDQDGFDGIVKYIFMVLDNGSNPELTQEWVQDNVTLPQANKIIDASRLINGLGDFFQKGVGTDTKAQPKTERALEEQAPPTPSA